MNGLRAYLLRIVFCAFFVSLAGAIPLQKPVKRAVMLCGGCIMILVVLRPLIGADFALLPDRWLSSEWGLEQSETDAEEVYREIMQELIETQTVNLLTEKAAELGVSAEFRVELIQDEASGQFVPWAVETVGVFTSEQRQGLSAYITEALNIPGERQRWRIA